MTNEFIVPETYNASFHGDLDENPYIKKLPYRQLGRTSLKLSQVSYGGSFLASFYGDFDYSEAIQSIQKSIKYGINYIDTSPWYGGSEDAIGMALKNVPRNAYYIGTKVGRNFTPSWDGRFDFSANAVLKSFERSLSRLGLDYVDVIQVHDVEFAIDPNQIVKETIPALESIVKAGKAKYIGITGYDLSVLKRIADQTQLDTVLSYCRYNLNDTSLVDYLPYFQEKGIGVINASPVSMGLLTTAGHPEWHPASPEIKAQARQAAKLAHDRGTTLEKVSVGFSLRPKENTITTTLVSIPTTKILEENLNIATQPLEKSDEELHDEFRGVFNHANQHWEGTEVAEYKKTLKNLNV